MGCIHSKADVIGHNDTSPNTFRVINIDDEGQELWSGQLEITMTELVLHRRGREPTYWPLKCLRRYGYDSDMFSFESGRRCTTGEGIYAFRCKRADVLFRTLQDYLQRRAYLTDDRNLFPVPTNTNGPALAPRVVRSSTNNNNTTGANTVGVLSVGNHVTDRTVLTVSQSLSPLNSSGRTAEMYLEPNHEHRFATGNRVGSLSSAGGPLSPDLASPGSPGSFTNILEVTPLPNPGGNLTIQYGISNVYQEFPVREFNNNKRASLDTPPVERAPVPTQAAQEDNITSRTYENTSPISLKHSMSGEAVASTDDYHSYMNVALGVTSPTGDDSNTNIALRTPTTSNFKRMDSISNDPSRSYENMEPLLTRMRHSKPEIFSKVDLPATPTSFAMNKSKEEERTVNYIVLDLHYPTTTSTTTQSNATTKTENNGLHDSYSLHNIPHNSNGISNSSSIEHRKILQYSNSFDSSLVISSTGLTASNSLGLLPPESPKKLSLGYAMIDFNKTVALSNTVSNSIGSPTSDHDVSDGSRRTRHS